jgi:hypothetical protein
MRYKYNRFHTIVTKTLYIITEFKEQRSEVSKNPKTSFKGDKVLACRIVHRSKNRKSTCIHAQ